MKNIKRVDSIDIDCMTIAISIKVNDGVVLAADSASTLFQVNKATKNFSVMNVYEHADKVFNLYKGFPIGAVTWGAGGIGRESTSTLTKDFRKLLQKDDNLKIDEENYTIKEIADKFKNFFYDKYTTAYKDLDTGKATPPSIGFIVAGYSAGKYLSEEYLIEIAGKCKGPDKFRPEDQGGAAWFGQPEAIFRLIKGYSSFLPNMLKKMSVPAKDIEIILEECSKNLEMPLIHDAMPIQDAIDLAKFLVELTKNFVRFNPGAQVVGGPVDIAAITKHEGFKWVNRKQYYSEDVNLTV